jgi:hypothetical protein
VPHPPFPLFPIPYSLFPIPYSLFPIPYPLFPIPYSLPSPHFIPTARHTRSIVPSATERARRAPSSSTSSR